MDRFFFLVLFFFSFFGWLAETVNSKEAVEVGRNTQHKSTRGNVSTAREVGREQRLGRGQQEDQDRKKRPKITPRINARTTSITSVGAPLIPTTSWELLLAAAVSFRDCSKKLRKKEQRPTET